jgi:transposase
MNANLLFTWRRAAEAILRAGEGGAVAFVPAAITADPVPATAPPLRSDAGRMEIALAGGDRVIVGADVDPVALARVIKVLSRR